MTGGATGLAVLAALASSFCFAAAFVSQQHVAARVPPEDARGLRLFRELARSGIWWAGFLGDIGGFALQALALAFGSIVLVQPFLVTAMVFALPLAARWNGRRIARRELAWACVVVVALALFSVLAHTGPGATRPPLRAWLAPGVAALAVIGGALAIAWFTRRTARAAAMGIATGVAYGIVAALTDVVVHVLSDDGLPALLRTWELWALALAVLGGSAVQQGAFHAGELAASLPATQVLEPVSGVLLGIAVLGATLTESAAAWAVMGLAVAAMAAGTVALARSAARAPT